MLCAPSSHRIPRRWTAAALTVIALVLVYGLLPCDDVYARIEAGRRTPRPAPEPEPGTRLCPLRELDDVLVVLKTGATESQTKVPVHLNTTLRCVPHFAVFSDYDERIAGVRAHDILRDLAERVKVAEPEFELYRRLRARGREALLQDQQGDHQNEEGDEHTVSDGGAGQGMGKQDNAGWRLDKWKFLPMLDGALRERPTARWFVFVEADTYVVWPNLAAWLARLDPARAYYLAAPMASGDEVFGYGGAGIVLSQAAVRKVVEESRGQVEERTKAHWAGDAVLGRALADADVPLVWASPMLQTERVWEVDELGAGADDGPWCYPAVSYHHMTVADIEAMWAFEQEWFRDEKNGVLLHGDVFKGFLFNGIAQRQDDWDNRASEPVPDRVASFDDCAAECDLNPTCLQFSFRNGTCMTSPSAIRGVRRRGVQSGWMASRIESVVSRVDSCPETEYIYE
ncbi:hypothetical protein HFD88_000164 [Aspergillus terreus]|nr:hypothetical protein HFD88_000164 [Aspergillus terreus]